MEDYRDVEARVLKEAEGKLKDEKVESALTSLRNIIESYAILSRLFKIDIQRRIGEVKKDPRFWVIAVKDFDDCRESLLANIATFEVRHLSLIGQDEKIREMVDELKTALAERQPESLEKIFYKGTCRNHSSLISTDQETFEASIPELVSLLEKAQ